jgi:hypothetical protein
MPYYKRNGYRWSIPEILRLQREFELLELNIEEISRRHQRTPYAIANRLVDEGFASQECKEVSQYLGFIPYNNTDTSVSDNNMSLSISENEDEESRSDITNDSEDEISTLKSQVSDLNTKLDSILSMLKRSNGGSVIGMY